MATAREAGIQITLSEEENMDLGRSTGGQAGEDRARENYRDIQNNAWQAKSILVR